MKGQAVPDTDHILRYVGGRHVDLDSDGQPAILGGGFISDRATATVRHATGWSFWTATLKTKCGGCETPPGLAAAQRVGWPD